MSYTSNAAHPQGPYSQNSGITPTNTFSPVFMSRDPNSHDVNYQIKQYWINTSNGNLWVLVAFSIVASVTSATWLAIAGSTFQVETLTGDDGVIIVPSALSNINIDGLTVANATNAKPVFTKNTSANTMSVEVQVAEAATSSGINNAGLASFESTQFAVDANGFVTLAGGSSPSVLGITPDAHTPPGTTPVVPNGSGNITVTGGQVAAGTTANAIQTNSLAANTYTIQVQRSQAVGSSTVGDNGVCHFNSAQFAVDANGFVSLTASEGFIWQNISASQTLVVGHGYFCSGGGALSLLLPATSAVGDTIKIILIGSTSWTITQGVGQQIQFGVQATTSGAGGSLASSAIGDAVTIVCQTANTIWVVENSVGNLTVT